MILEIAEFTAQPGQADAFKAGIARGLAVIRSAPGCVSADCAQSIEQPEEFALFVRWQRLEDHLEGFRTGPLFPAYRQHIAGLFVDAPRVRHYPVGD